MSTKPSLRNQFIHRRPYGARYVEAFGHIMEIAPEIGLYRYIRPVVVQNDTKDDVLDLVVKHYKQATALFQDMAEASHQNLAMPKFAKEDIISIKWNKR